MISFFCTKCVYYVKVQSVHISKMNGKNHPLCFISLTDVIKKDTKLKLFLANVSLIIPALVHNIISKSISK